MEFLQNEQTAVSVIFLLLLFVFVVWIAQRNGFFQLPLRASLPPVTLLQVAGAFAVYIVFSFLILPILFFILTFVRTGEWRGIENIPIIWREWAQCGGLCIMFVLLVIYSFLIRPQARHFIFWGERAASRSRFLSSIGMGCAAWLISYPFVIVSSIFSGALSQWIWGERNLEQVVVVQLKNTLHTPSLFICMAVAVIVLVPFMEELLFRGFLQNLLKRYLGRAWAIAMTAIIFSCVHFAPSQGTSNFQLIFSLLALSGFLGFLYERQQTLWAPITLHMVFNTVNVIGIVSAQT